MPNKPKTYSPQGKSPDQQRGSAAKRGYDRQWRKFRIAFLRQHPLCEDCLENKRVTAATDVHHKIKVALNPRLKLVESNCKALCSACHDRRTALGE